MNETYILALDQGTSSSRAILFDHAGRIVHQVNQAFPQYYPQPGWVEHDPHDLWNSQIATARQVLQQTRVHPSQIAALGVTNQRETTLIWDRASGVPIYPAIVWQCRRTAPLVEALRAQGWEEVIRQRTGLVLDAYFSATKICWLLEHVPGARRRAQQGELAFGTVDTWLLYHLSAGRLHCTDYSNASRTMLYNIHTRQWDEEILRALDIPSALLPEVRDSSGDFGCTAPGMFEGTAIPIGGVIGDQQGALFGQACFLPGMVKNTYGTGSFVLMHSGSQPPSLSPGLLSTIAWGIEGKLTYALEGSIFSTGSTIQWLRDALQLLHSSAESAALAMSVPDTNGVYFVPAFTGLGSPHWDMYARGLLIGLSRGTTRAHIVRAGLEAMAYQTCDVLHSMMDATTVPVSLVRVDGAAAANDFAMQFQSDMLQVPVQRPQTLETTALGAAYLAGLAVGYWENLDHIAARWCLERTYTPQFSAARRQQAYTAWQEAVRRSRGWAATSGEITG
ncbi:MAG: glycerol kinase GlpK [Candidatus Tectimicrobiota bacterium]